MTTKDARINIRLSPAQAAKLNALTIMYRVSVSDFLRSLIDAEYKRSTGTDTPPQYEETKNG